MTLTHFDSPIGRIAIVTQTNGALHALGFVDEHPRMDAELAAPLSEGSAPAVTEALAAYFAGDLTALDALPVDPTGTPFQTSVWTALRTIPAGQTRSYGEVAQAVGRPKAVRAVGAANGANPVALVVPCHRVIGANGTLTGYGGGLDRKRWLLEHEQSQRALIF